jgi:hypothetical protein
MRPRTASRTKWTARSLVAMLVAAGSAAALAGPAQAYDRTSCDNLWGPGNVESVDTVHMNTGSVGKVDFADNAHFFHTPYGNAVVCWAKNGRVAVQGRLYADPHAGSATVSVSFVYYNDGVDLTSWRSSDLTGSASDSAAVNREIVHAPVLPKDEYDKVRIRLYSGDSTVATLYHYR